MLAAGNKFELEGHKLGSEVRSMGLARRLEEQERKLGLGVHNMVQLGHMLVPELQGMRRGSRPGGTPGETGNSAVPQSNQHEPGAASSQQGDPPSRGRELSGALLLSYRLRQLLVACFL